MVVGIEEDVSTFLNWLNLGPLIPYLLYMQSVAVITGQYLWIRAKIEKKGLWVDSERRICDKCFLKYRNIFLLSFYKSHEWKVPNFFSFFNNLNWHSHGKSAETIDQLGSKGK